MPWFGKHVPMSAVECCELSNPAARARNGSCGNKCHDMRYHRSTMVLRGRGSTPAAALSGSLFLKPPALPEDTYYCVCSADLQFRLVQISP